MLALISILTLTLASGPSPKTNHAYASWVGEVTQAVGTSSDPVDRVVVDALRGHACRTLGSPCISADHWHALEKDLEHGTPPAALALLATNAQERNENALVLWERVAAADPDNAYPLILIAAQEWVGGERDHALDVLRRATTLPRTDDYFPTIVGYVKALVQAHPPAPTQLQVCALEALPENPDQLEIDSSVIFSIACDIGLGGRLANLKKLCSQDASAWDEDRAQLCQRAGTQLRGTGSLLTRSFGLMLQQEATRDETLLASLKDEQKAQSDRLYNANWWKEVGRDVHTRRAAAAIWLATLATDGEVPAAEALRNHFGPAPETATQRNARRNAIAAKEALCASSQE